MSNAFRSFACFATAIVLLVVPSDGRAESERDIAFYETRIRPLLARHCYECHSEEAKKSEGGLLLDRRSGWLDGGDTGKAVVPGQPDDSLIIKAVRHSDEIQMPPEKRLSDKQVNLLVAWIRRGAPGAKQDLGETSFSRLGDQEHLSAEGKHHWAFLPLQKVSVENTNQDSTQSSVIDRFVQRQHESKGLSFSETAEPHVLARRLYFDLSGLPPTLSAVKEFEQSLASNGRAAVENLVDELIESPAFGEHLGRMWLDVARYADTDSFYRPDTKTPHYFPFAFTYRDYVIESFNADKPLDLFIKEQLAADLLSSEANADMRALGFLTVGPYANRDPLESLDEWIDVTSRGLMGLTVACARCHDHKYEPIPTEDYYSLRGIFASVNRVDPLDEVRQPLVPGYSASAADVKDYESKREAIQKKIDTAGGKKSKGNNRSIATKIRQTELAELLLFHRGAPARTMIVIEKKQPFEQPVYQRGDASVPGPIVPRRFLKVIDEKQEPFSEKNSGRLQLAEKIVSPENPLTARVYVNRVWGYLMGSHLVTTPSDFGLQGAAPTHPELLDWLARDFIDNGWSTKRLVRQIVMSKTYQQRSDNRNDMAIIDSENEFLWRSHRKRLRIEEIRDSLLAVSGQLDRSLYGRPSELWGNNYTRRRTLYGYINRFNLDPTLRSFDFPTPMQTNPTRGESIVAPQSLFTLNSPFVVEQAAILVKSENFERLASDDDRIKFLVATILQREAAGDEMQGIGQFVSTLKKGKDGPNADSAVWTGIAQALMMSNEFQYID